MALRGGPPSTMLAVTDGTFHLLLMTDHGQIGSPNQSLGGRPARIVEQAGDGGSPIMEVQVDRDGTLFGLTASGRYDPATVRRIVAELDWVGGDDPATWPVDPLKG